LAAVSNAALTRRNRGRSSVGTASLVLADPVDMRLRSRLRSGLCDLRNRPVEPEDRRTETELGPEARREQVRQRIAAADRILARERRQREREEAEREEALRHPTPTEQWNARRGLVAQQLGLHPSQVPDGHVDYLFDRLGTAFMVGYQQAGRGRGAPTRRT